MTVSGAAPRVADGGDRVAGLRVGVGQLGRRDGRPQGLVHRLVEADDGEVGDEALRRHVDRQGAALGGLHLEDLGPLDHVAVGHDRPVVDEEPGADPEALAGRRADADGVDPRVDGGGLVDQGGVDLRGVRRRDARGPAHHDDQADRAPSTRPRSAHVRDPARRSMPRARWPASRASAQMSLTSSMRVRRSGTASRVAERPDDLVGQGGRLLLALAHPVGDDRAPGSRSRERIRFRSVSSAFSAARSRRRCRASSTSARVLSTSARPSTRAASAGSLRSFHSWALDRLVNPHAVVAASAPTTSSTRRARPRMRPLLCRPGRARGRRRGSRARARPGADRSAVAAARRGGAGGAG